MGTKTDKKPDALAEADGSPSCAEVRGSALLPIGSPCSIYQTYTLRVEVKARGSWFADTNWHEDELAEARARVAEIEAKKSHDREAVRLIRIRFEVLPNT